MSNQNNTMNAIETTTAKITTTEDAARIMNANQYRALRRVLVRFSLSK